MFKKYSFAEVDSTNNEAKKLLANSESVQVTADFQTSGKGRNGKNWHGSKAKNIYVSFGFKTEQGESADEITKYQMLGSLAVLKSLKDVAPQLLFTLKYPNDIIAENNILKGKISGILCEHEFMGMMCYTTIIGIGINVNQEKFDDVIDNKPVSLQLLKVETDREILLEKLRENIIELLKEDKNKIIELWKKELDIIDKVIKIKGIKGKWTVKEILSDGRLKAFKNEEIKTISNGDSIRYLQKL